VQVLPPNEVRKSGKIWEEGSSGNSELRKVTKKSLHVLNLESNLANAQLFDRTIIILQQPYSLIQQVLLSSENDKASLLRGNSGMHRWGLNWHRVRGKKSP